MKFIEALSRKYPIPFYIVAIGLLIGLGWGYYKLAHSAWAAAAILSGLLITLSFSSFRQIRPSLWSFISNLGASFAVTWVYFVSDAKWWGQCLYMLLFLPVFLIANQAMKADVKRDMRRRSQQANRLTERILSGEASDIPPFGLFLRPFISTGRLLAQTIPRFETNINQASFVDFETIFKRAFNKEIQLVALGRPEDISEGIARVTTSDDQWQAIVRKLMDQALFIIALPSAHEGTLWEFRELKARQLIGKTAFLMPEFPREQPGGIVVNQERAEGWDAGITYYNPADHTIDYRNEWKMARDILRREGYDLPPYAQPGALFTLFPDTLRLKQVAPLPLSVLSQQEGYIQNILAELQLIPGVKGLNRSFLDLLEEATFNTRNNKEYVYFLAFDVYVTTGDAETASIAIERINQITRQRSTAIDEAFKTLVGAIADPAQQAEILAYRREWEAYLQTLGKVRGIPTERVEQLERALQGVIGHAQGGDQAS